MNYFRGRGHLPAQCPQSGGVQGLAVVLRKAWFPQMHLYSTPYLSCCSQSLRSHLPGRGLETGLASPGCVWEASDHCM